ncbi:hypothetical protein DFH08DRAFT_808756 [Mycena albidolilacea]|uniref:Uncharacterized protein n=1 Tax=Mycena albidolilacea TaxID=1033008 RepID=A0AAD7ES07_9AGAR|nr:hypothetical protein DFH08DRAFT_808756 [Mycena albidolilacea]
MAKQRTKTMEEQLEEVKAQLAENQKELEAKKDELGAYSASKLHAEKPVQKLIPHPKGQAGKGKNSYVLWDAMQLTNNAARYQHLLVQKEVKYFQHFQGGWPVHAMLKQYVQNTNDKFNRDLRVEKAAEVPVFYPASCSGVESHSSSI